MTDPLLNSLVIPCYNEQMNLQALEAKLLALPKKIKGEVILVDNGSSDGTREYIKTLNARCPDIVLAVVEKNIGYGFGILTGLKQARGAYVGWTHADGQMDVFDAAAAFDLLSQQADPSACLVMGSRNGRSLYDRFFTFGMAVVESLLFGTLLNDITAQPKVMARAFVESWPAPPYDFSLDLYAYVLAKKRGVKIVKFPVTIRERLYGVSTWNTGIASRLRLIRRTLVYSFQLRRKSFQS